MSKFFTAILLFFAVSLSAQSFTFECVCGYIDSAKCDICGPSVASRSMQGLLIYKDNVAYRWIDLPYVVKISGRVAEFTELMPNGDKIRINMGGTNFDTMPAFKAAVLCSCGGGGIGTWTVSDSLQYQAISGDTLYFVGAGIASVVYDSMTHVMRITATELDGNPTNEAQTLAAGGAGPTSYTISLSQVSGIGGGTITFAEGTGINLTRSSQTITVENTAPDQVVSITGAGINTVTGTYPNFTITGTEVDGSITNELQNLSLTGQALGISSGTGVSLPIIGVSAGTGIGVSVSSGIATVSNTGDLSTTNEGILGVSAGTGTTSVITSNTSGATGVTITAGTGTSISETTSTNGGNITITNSAPDQTVSISGGGINVVTGTYPNFTVTGTEVDGSTTNEPLTISDGTNSETLGGQTLTVVGAGGNTAAYNAATNTLTITGTSSTLPTGTDKQTLRYNGTTLTANSALTNDGTYIGINSNPLSGFHLYVNGASRYDGSQIIRGTGSYISTVTSPHFRLWNTTATTGDTWYVASTDAGEFHIESSNLGANQVNITTTGQFQITNGLRIGSVSGAPTSIIGRNASGDVGAVTVGSGLTLSGGTLSASGGSGTVTSVAATAPAAGFTITGSPITTSGTLTFSLANDLAGLEGLSTNGIAARTGTSTWATRTLTAGTGISITNGDGVSGNPTITCTVSGGGTVNQSTTLVDGRVTLSAGSNLITDDGGFKFDRTNDIATIGTGSGTASGMLSLLTPATNTTVEGVRFQGSTTGNLVSSIINGDNTTSATSSSIFQLSVGGTTTLGDPIMQFTVAGTGGITTAVGIDNSDTRKFKITPGSATPGGTTNNGLIITSTSTPLVGVNIDAPLFPLHVNGDVRADRYRGKQVTDFSTSNIALGTGAGTSGTVNSVSGTQNALQVTFTTGTSAGGGAPVANGVIMTITFPSAYASAVSYGTFSARATDSTGADLGKFKYVQLSTTQAQIVNCNGVLQAGVQYGITISLWGI